MLQLFQVVRKWDRLFQKSEKAFETFLNSLLSVKTGRIVRTILSFQ